MSGDEGLVRRFVRGVIQVHVLHHASQGELHGAWVSAELLRHGYRISPGTLYPLLHGLEADGLLASRKKVVDGHALRVYVITARGRRALARLRAALAELADEVLVDRTPALRRRGRKRS